MNRAFALLLIGLASACGSTVPLSGQGSLNAGGSALGGLPNATSAGVVAANGGSAGSGLTPSEPPAAAPMGSSLAPPGATSISPATEPSVASKDQLTVGILGIKPVNGAAGAAGVGTAQTLSPSQAYQAAAASYKGTIAGHKFRVVTAEISPTSGSFASDYQAACEKLTIDNHANVVLSSDVLGNETFSACVARAGIAQINAGYGSMDIDDYRRFPNSVNLDVADADRKMANVIDDAVSVGTLHAKDPVGVVVEGCPLDQRVYTRTVVPHLRAAGITKVVREDVDCVGNFGGIAGAASAMSGAVLRFKSAGAKAVLFVSNFESVYLIFLSEQDNNQGFHPTYVLSSTGVPSTALSNVPNGERHALTGSGTLVASDVTAGSEAVTTTQRACFAAMGAAGHPVAGGSQVDALAAYDACDSFTVLDKALQVTGGGSSGSVLRAAINSISSSVRLAGTVDGSLRLTPSSPTGPARSRHFAYSSACACLVYTEPSRSF